MRTRSSARPAPCSRSRTPTAAGTRSTPARARARSTRPGSSSGRCSGSACPATIRPSPGRLRYLLSQQQDFGGWFQTTTHENFRTPMRETRYAVMALAEAFPGRMRPRRGWGNRDDGPARLPRIDSLGPHARRSRKPLGRPRAGSGSISRERSPRCSITPSRWSGHRPRPAWADWSRRSRSRPWSAGSTIRPRSSGARPPGPCDGWATRGIGIGRDRRGTRRPEPADPPRRRPDLRLPVPRDGPPARPGRVADRADPRPGPLDATPGPPDLAPVVLPHARHGTRPADRRHLPRADGRARCRRSSART